MGYSIFPLVFDTPVHFGNVELGGDLSSCTIEYSSDTLVGALLHELSEYGDEELLVSVRDKLCQHQIIFSDLLPYVRSGDGEYNLYLPKPILMGKRKPLAKELDTVRKMATKLKKQKKMAYIRASRMKEYMESIMQCGDFTEDVSFYDTALMERVNMRGDEPLPYFVGSCNFRANAGMYVIAYTEYDDDKVLIKRLLKYVLRGGIGGKRSSGYGKARLSDDISEYNSDWKEILSMLDDSDKGWQMSISSIIPEESELDIVQQGFYKLKDRGGFVSSFGTEDVKKNSVSVLSSGSCFPNRIAGKKVILSNRGNKPVERFGTGLFVGLGIYE